MLQRMIYFFGSWEPPLHPFFDVLSEGDTFIDIGANIGYWSLFAAGKVGSGGRIVAIEAVLGTFQKLQANVARNRYRNIRLVHAAVTDYEGTVRMYSGREDNTGSASILRPVGTAEEVRCAPVHRLLEEREIASARLVKIDVEGAEDMVVRGMEPLLARVRDDTEFLVELTPDLADTDTVIATFRRHGLHPYVLPEARMEDFYVDPEPRAERLRTRLSECRDVLFSRIDADMIDPSRRVLERQATTAS